MIRIGIIGDIGSGKTFVANNFGYPVFSADLEVAKIYKKDKKVFLKLKNKLPKYITKFPINKNEITNAILNNQNNLSKIIKIVPRNPNSSPITEKIKSVSVSGRKFNCV